MQPIQIGNFEYTKDDKGEWIYKAKESNSLSSKKVNPKYQEKPQFKLQETIEGKSKIRFSKVMNYSVIEITKFLKDNLS
jgi:hypothetical protein